MFCGKCGRKLNEGDRFCESCGTKVASPQEKESTENLNMYNQRKINEGGTGYTSPTREETSIQEPEQGPQPSQTFNRGGKKSSNKLIIAVLVVLLIALGLGIIYILTRDKGTNNDISTETDVTDVVGETREEETEKEKPEGKKEEEGKEESKEGTSSTPKVFDYSNIEKSEDSGKGPYESEETMDYDPNQRYLFQTDREVISEDDLSGFDRGEISIIRNEIYARHGYVFKNKELQAYFEAYDWYEPNPNFSEALFNGFEKENVTVISNYEKKMGWR
ncbi:MAG: YARHG domain-containing protein [Tissierellia bacterium]|nr:YARHG domain-containing protein [Tissierellia bacterium]